MNDRPDLADAGGLLKIQQRMSDCLVSSYWSAFMEVQKEVPGVRSADGDVVSSDDVDQEFDVSI